MNSSAFQITTPDYYNESSSLVQDIDFLSDSKNEINDQVIANMIMKFIFCYYHISATHAQISFQELTHFFQEMNMIASDKNVSKPAMFQKRDTLEGFYHLQSYALRMACDIASTVELVRDIISREIQIEAFDGKYL